jgi:hypothetical protein
MSYTEITIQKVWDKGATVENADSRFWRKDQCGAWIARNHYGDKNSLHGWEIDRISEEGEDEPANIRSLQWQNKESKKESSLTCPVVSVGPPPF